MRANKHLLLWSSLGALGMLGWAAYRENIVQEWRQLQRAYRAALAPELAAAFQTELRQVVVAATGTADRCVSCHVGMATGESGVAGHPVYTPHPAVGHDPSEFGCTVCHGGQGRATQSADAHGDVRHWPEPMIPVRHAEAGCGSCHTPVGVPSREGLALGLATLERHDCLACHRLDGRGGTLRPGGAGGMEGPDLSRVGGQAVSPDWYDDHLAQHRAASAGAWRSAFAEIPAADLRVIEGYLATRVGAPALVQALSALNSSGCRGCHRVSGVGGEIGPDLTIEGLRDPGQLSFTGVRDEHTLGGWLADHFRAPRRVVAGSQMPALGLGEEEIDALTLAMLSLRREDRPGSMTPADRLRTERLGEREFAQDGATVFGTFCTGCHGLRGEGTRFPGARSTPSVANPDFLAVADDRFLMATLRQGRPGPSGMPAWGDPESGLRPQEIEAVITHLRALGRTPPPPPGAHPRRWIRADPAPGEAMYARLCAGCHGPQGEGGEGPALANPVLLTNATDTYLVETILRGRRGTPMRGFGTPSTVRPQLTSGEVESIVAHLRTWEVEQ